MGQQPDRNMWAQRTTFVDKDKCNDCLLHYSSLREDASFALNLRTQTKKWGLKIKRQES